jgi:DNA-binding GntR family transcriptional regulator
MKYLEIYQKLKTGVETGKYPLNSMLPKSPDLAREYGVSLQTIQKARKLLEMEGYLKGIPSKGTLVINKNQIHHYFVKSKSHKIGILVPYMHTATIGNA